MRTRTTVLFVSPASVNAPTVTLYSVCGLRLVSIRDKSRAATVTEEGFPSYCSFMRTLKPLKTPNTFLGELSNDHWTEMEVEFLAQAETLAGLTGAVLERTKRKNDIRTNTELMFVCSLTFQLQLFAISVAWCDFTSQRTTINFQLAFFGFFRTIVI